MPRLVQELGLDTNGLLGLGSVLMSLACLLLPPVARVIVEREILCVCVCVCVCVCDVCVCVCVCVRATKGMR
jgi:hypothetical protein